MSAKKSWDLERKPSRPASAPVAAPRRATRSVEPVRAKLAPKGVPPARQSSGSAKRNVTIARGTRERKPDGPSLKLRRKKARRVGAIALAIASVLIIAALIYLSWLPQLRVSTVHAEGPGAEDVERIAAEQLTGTHLFIVPRNSLFFIPEPAIRRAVLAAHPEVSAVSIAADGLTSVRVASVPRARAFIWCGSAPDALETVGCYDADTEGLVFAPSLDTGTASSTATLKVYAPLGDDALEPVRAHLSGAYRIPDMLQFVKAIRSLGANVASVAFRGDEADLYTASGTRITYVLSRERDALALAASAFPELSVNDGSLEYVDLRFEGKVYIRRRTGTTSGE